MRESGRPGSRIVVLRSPSRLQLPPLPAQRETIAMNRMLLTLLALVAATGVASPATGQQPGTARPQQVLAQEVTGMPTAPTQEVRVLTATFQPGDRTVFHTHRSPVTVYVL